LNNDGLADIVIKTSRKGKHHIFFLNQGNGNYERAKDEQLLEGLLNEATK